MVRRLVKREMCAQVENTRSGVSYGKVVVVIEEGSPPAPVRMFCVPCDCVSGPRKAADRGWKSSKLPGPNGAK